MGTENVYQPSDIFNALLYELSDRGIREFNGKMRQLHNAFYAARLKYPELMEGYKFLKTLHPYSSTLQQTEVLLQLGGIITHLLDGNIRINKPENLAIPDPELRDVARLIADSLE